MSGNSTGQNPAESLEERLTRQFYEWEMPGRGWQLWTSPVEPEPPFRPFFGHYDSLGPNKIVDDGRKPTLLSALADGLRALIGRGSQPQAPATELPDEPEPGR